MEQESGKSNGAKGKNEGEGHANGKGGTRHDEPAAAQEDYQKWGQWQPNQEKQEEPPHTK